MTEALVSNRHRLAVLDVEARRLARTCAHYGVLTRPQLVELSGARRWSRGRFDLALGAALERGMVRDLGLGFYAVPPDPRTDGRKAAHPPSRGSISSHDMDLDQADFEHLLELRTGLRRFLRWSEEQAEAAGLSPAKHQLLLAIKGHPDPAGPTISEIADYLVLRHHSAVGLVDRAVKDGLVQRAPDPASKSVVRVTLTPAGAAKLDSLAGAHLQEISHLAPTMRTLWRQLERDEDGTGPHPAVRRRVRRAQARARVKD